MKSEPRKIVLILGNGFDLDLGLKTSYKDFWESEFCPRDYPAPLIQHLNQRWQGGHDAVKWYDLENELFAYATKEDKRDVVNNKDCQYIRNNPDDILFNRLNHIGIDNTLESLINRGLVLVTGDAIKDATIRFREDYNQPVLWRDRRAFQLIKEGLCAYLNTLSYENLNKDSIAHEVISLMGFCREDGHFVDVYSFNYTKTVVNDYLPLGRIVNHVHGTCSSSIIVGTGDSLSVGKDYDFLLKSYDRAYNPPSLEQSLLDADKVIFFGHSIGENDRQYFKAFFKRQTDYSHPKSKEITFFTRNDESEIEIKRALQKMTDGNLSTLFGLNDVHIIKTEDTEENQNAFKAFHDRVFLYGHPEEEIEYKRRQYRQ